VAGTVPCTTHHHLSTLWLTLICHYLTLATVHLHTQAGDLANVNLGSGLREVGLLMAGSRCEKGIGSSALALQDMSYSLGACIRGSAPSGKSALCNCQRIASGCPGKVVVTGGSGCACRTPIASSVILCWLISYHYCSYRYVYNNRASITTNLLIQTFFVDTPNVSYKESQQSLE